MSTLDIHCIQAIHFIKKCLHCTTHDYVLYNQVMKTNQY